MRAVSLVLYSPKEATCEVVNDVQNSSANAYMFLEEFAFALFLSLLLWDSDRFKRLFALESDYSNKSYHRTLQLSGALV